MASVIQATAQAKTANRRAVSGFTLVELLLALALFSLLVLAVVRLLDASLRVLGEGEVQRDHLGLELVASEWLVRDLDNLVGGSDADFLVDWWAFDADADGIASRPWPRLRLVRRAAPRDLVRLGQRNVSTDAVASELGVGARAEADALVEVVWLALPAVREGQEGPRGDGVLLRGERIVDGSTKDSFFDAGFFDPRGFPPGWAVSEVARGLLWFDVRLADETSLLDRGWELGSEPGKTAAAWDARGEGRPDTERHVFNAMLPAPPWDGSTLRLPRRIRVELEFERPSDRLRKPALAAEVDAESTAFVLDAAARLPDPGGLLLIGDEWVEHLSTRGNTIAVRRAQRGTRAVVHRPGVRVQWGRGFFRELAPILYREDWRR